MNINSQDSQIPDTREKIFTWWEQTNRNVANILWKKVNFVNSKLDYKLPVFPGLQYLIKNQDFQSFTQFIDSYFDLIHTSFTIWETENNLGKNTGTLRVVGYAKLMWLSIEQTLPLFWEHYESVKNYPEWTDHANIRALITAKERWIQSTWDAVIFWTTFAFPLILKKEAKQKND